MLRTFQFRVSLLILVCCFLFPESNLAQVLRGATGSLTVLVQGPDGAPLDELAMVNLTDLPGEYNRQASTRAGSAEFTGLQGGTYSLTVIAVGFKRAVEQLQLSAYEASVAMVRMEPIADVHANTAPASPPILAPQAKKELGKALEALRSGKLADAHNHVAAAYRLAPGNPEVNYIYGLYYAQANDSKHAQEFWQRALSLYPKHGGALLSLGALSLQENKPGEAASYFRKAIEAEPSSWRAHALLAVACWRQDLLDESIQEAEHAEELGHGEAAIVEPLLARGYAKRGDTERAMHVLQSYVLEHPSDAAAAKELAKLRSASLRGTGTEAIASVMELPLLTPIALPALLIPSSWLPADVDESVPPVEPGTACPLEQVLQETGKRMEEFVRNVDRFTASESVTHQSINKWGLAASPDKFKFDYVVSIDEIGPGMLDVEEYRTHHYSPSQFPDGIQRTGLATLALIFHPYNAGNFEMTCEGMGHWNNGLAWQVHFRQRTDRPNTIRVYQLGENGATYPGALKGRAWIATDSYQIVRLETDLVAPMPQIRLVADHTAVEYGRVKFRSGKVNLWLPQTAEFYYDWRGHRGHRVHRFSNYLLFSVDERQHISTPQAGDSPQTSGPG